jgi:hypothetical protein
MGTEKAGKSILRPWAVARNAYIQLNNHCSLTESGRHVAHTAAKFNFLGQLSQTGIDGFPKGNPA